MARAAHTPSQFHAAASRWRSLVFGVLAGMALWQTHVGSAQTPPAPDAVTQLAQRCFERAQVAYFEGRLAEARRGFECAYKQLPSPEMAWNLARVNERMGEVEEGVRYFREYLATAKLSPRERRRVQGRITALLDLGQRQRASIKLNPEEQRRALSDEARAFFDRGTKLYAAGHYQAAAAAFTAALQLSDAPELHYNLAVAAERLGDVADALDHYRAYLEALPEAPDRVEVLARLDALRNELR
jgi:tetratricopeptide (TPR) repeat protein